MNSPENIPTLGRRLLSDLLDGGFVFIIFVITSKVIYSKESQNYSPHEVYLLFFIITLLYFPLLNTTFCTLGQLITNTRVISLKIKKLSFWQASARLIGKLLFGWVSIWLVLFNRNNRFIHDFLGQSIVVFRKDLKSINQDWRRKNTESFGLISRALSILFFIIYLTILCILIFNIVKLRLNKI